MQGQLGYLNKPVNGRKVRKPKLETENDSQELKMKRWRQKANHREECTVCPQSPLGVLRNCGTQTN
jgi:hypothetical protein